MSQVAADPIAKGISEALNEVKFSRFHFRAIVTAGMGFFTSAYDLCVIGTAAALVGPIWHLQAVDTSLLVAASLAATFVGAFVFGRLADIIGRKSIYGIEAILMSVGAVGSAFCPSLFWLVICRVIMGFGIGGDYPLSAVIMSEYANRKDRGKMVGMVFSCQALGFLAGPLLAVILLAAGVNHDLSWRILLGAGAIPSLAVIFLRRTMPESPRWQARVSGNKFGAAAGMAAYTNGLARVAHLNGRDPRISAPLSKYLVTLIGTAGAWFALDYAFYGNSVCMPLIMKGIDPTADLLANLAWGAVIFGAFAVPGYVCAFMFADRIGRKRLQLLGFIMMALSFGAIGLFPQVAGSFGLFVVLFGLSFFFTQFGPNVTTFILAAELFPVNQRTTGHGISAGIGKVGACLGVFAFPWLNARLGVYHALIFSAGFAVLGMLLTLLIKEPAGKSLEEISGEDGLKHKAMDAPTASRLAPMAA